MEIHEGIISPFYVKVENANLTTFLKEFIEMTLDIEAKIMYTSSGIVYDWKSKENTPFSIFLYFIYFGQGIWVEWSTQRIRFVAQSP